ncbi:hypothetical protein [Paracoccus sp. SSK6]|uniref:hypothetical protein n=1 Tax=Paracoccus sp. SSK6 TaxID=3143131 RepID=UPI003219C6FC
MTQEDVSKIQSLVDRGLLPRGQLLSAQAELESVRKAAAQADTIDVAKVLDDAQSKAIAAFESDIAFNDPTIEYLADCARALRSVVEDIDAARRLVVPQAGKTPICLNLGDEIDVCWGGGADKLGLLRARSSSFE